MDELTKYQDFKKWAQKQGWCCIGRYNYSGSGYVVYEWRTPAAYKINITVDLRGLVRGSCTAGGHTSLDYF